MNEPKHRILANLLASDNEFKKARIAELEKRVAELEATQPRDNGDWLAATQAVMPDGSIKAAQSEDAEHHPVCDRRFPTLCDACIAENASPSARAAPGIATCLRCGKANLAEIHTCTPVQPASKPSEQEAHDVGAKGAPADDEERKLFEAWMRGHCWALSAEWDGGSYRGSSEHSGYFCPQAMRTRELWAAWRDRAALTRCATSSKEAAPVICAPFPGMDIPWTEEKKAEFKTALDAYENTAIDAVQDVGRAAAKMPNGSLASNVHEAYECGYRAAQAAQPVTCQIYGHALQTCGECNHEASQPCQEDVLEGVMQKLSAVATAMHMQGAAQPQHSLFRARCLVVETMDAIRALRTQAQPDNK